MPLMRDVSLLIEKWGPRNMYGAKGSFNLSDNIEMLM